MATIGIQRLVDGVLTSADLTHITILSHNGILVADNVLILPTSAGVYSYDVTYLLPGTYTAQWTFETLDASDDVVSRIFSVDSPVTTIQGVTLAEIERAVARGVGPYFRFRGGVGSTPQRLYVARLQSTLTLGDYEEMYILRRGEYYTDHSQVLNFSDDDRQRLVDTYDNITGTIDPDRDWGVGVLENEALELHALDPEQELRPAVQDGLTRCYFWDTATITATAYMREINLTDLVPWITRPKQVSRIEYGRTGYITSKVLWWDVYQSGGSVMLKVISPNIGSLRVHALRPVSTFVNNEYSASGPDSDNDILRVDLRYARLAGHMEAWNNYPDRLAPLAVNGLRAAQKDVAMAFTNRSRSLIGGEPEFIQNRFGLNDILEDLQIGNA